jgi:septum formation protein
MGELLVLASASPTRARLLREAGVAFEIDPAALDEGAVKRRFREAGGNALDCALALAEAKAALVALRHPGAHVLGADQILVAGAEWFDKPAGVAAARAQLQTLVGRTHGLATASCIVRDGARVWQATAEPRLTMRPFGAGFIDSYLAAEGEAVLGMPGAYRLEGRGAQLFSAVEGDHFAIQGLPLLALLGFLRAARLLPA